MNSHVVQSESLRMARPRNGWRDGSTPRLLAREATLLTTTVEIPRAHCPSALPLQF